jgi:hypothetical protein
MSRASSAAQLSSLRRLIVARDTRRCGSLGETVCSTVEHGQGVIEALVSARTAVGCVQHGGTELQGETTRGRLPEAESAGHYTEHQDAVEIERRGERNSVADVARRL